MRRVNREVVIALVIFGVLIAVAIVATIQQAETPVAPPLASFSAQPNGGKALRLWLEELDYDVDADSVAVFEPPDDTQLLLMLQPTETILESEWQVLDEWVEQGGTLLLAGDSFTTRIAVDHFDIEMLFESAEITQLNAQSPLLSGSLLIDSAEIEQRAWLSTERDDIVVHLANGEQPLIVSFDEGQGRVIIAATTRPFTNVGLQNDGNGAIVLNLIEGARNPGDIWFDEWHHGVRARLPDSLGLTAWLRQVPTGQAFLLAGLIILFALALGGRHFGRVWNPAGNGTRRTPLEFITAIANLNRRAGNREEVLENYRYRLKRSLGQRYRIDPRLSDAVFLEQLDASNPTIDIDEVRALLDRLYHTKMSEREMVKLSADITDFLNAK
jgi:hypothetical protein